MIDQFLQSADPNDIRNIINRFDARLQELEQKFLDVDKLEHLTQDMGEQQSGDFFGRFIAPAPGVEAREPTDPDFSGSFMSGAGEDFGEIGIYNVGGVKDGVLRCGFRQEDGRFYFGGGAGVQDEDGITITPGLVTEGYRAYKFSRWDGSFTGVDSWGLYAQDVDSVNDLSLWLFNKAAIGGDDGDRTIWLDCEGNGEVVKIQMKARNIPSGNFSYMDIQPEGIDIISNGFDFQVVQDGFRLGSAGIPINDITNDPAFGDGSSTQLATTESIVNYFGLNASGWTHVTLNDDAAISFIPPGSGGRGWIVVGCDLPTANDFGIVLYKATPTHSNTVGLSLGAQTNVTTGALTGTTGPDGKLTISAHTDEKLYIENRRGATREVYYGYIPAAVGPAGPTGATGADGIDGLTILNGSGAPGAGLGVDGDFYIDTTAHDLYGPKATTWPAGISLIGPLTDAPSDGNTYGRKNSAWETVTAGGGGGCPARSFIGL